MNDNMVLPSGYKFKKGRYKILRTIGQGGQCIVYLAEKKAKGKKYLVIKQLFASHESPEIQEEYVTMFRREYQLLSILAHPLLPKAYNSFQEDGKNFIAVEYIEGKDLDIILKSLNKPFPEDVVIEIGLEISKLLVYLSSREKPVVLRDIKPSNIIFTTEGNLKFIDFTIAREYSMNKSDTLKLGSPGYAPPEQYRGESEPKSDVYALGVTMYELLTMYEPSAHPHDVMNEKLERDSISEELWDIIKGAIKSDVKERYSQEDLCRCLSDLYEKRMKSNFLYTGSIKPVSVFFNDVYKETDTFLMDTSAKRKKEKAKKSYPVFKVDIDEYILAQQSGLSASSGWSSLLPWKKFFLIIVFFATIFNIFLLLKMSLGDDFCFVILLGLMVIGIVYYFKPRAVEVEESKMYTVKTKVLEYTDLAKTIEMPWKDITFIGFNRDNNEYLVKSPEREITIPKELGNLEELKCIIEQKTKKKCMLIN